MDSLFQSLEANNKAMGSVAITVAGKPLYTRAIGYSFVEPEKKADNHTRYRIGSITKMFTATMVLQLVEEKKLSLSVTLDKFFPEIPHADKITIEQLLRHRSGIHNFTDDEAYQNYMQQPKQQKELLEIMVKGGSDFEPDSKAEYSNSNYVLLGYIIEKISKKPYATVLKERITTKAGLTETSYGSKADATKNESRSYQFLNGWQPMPETDMSIPHGAGAIVSTPSDLNKFIEALFGHKLLSAASLEQMKTLRDEYGMGMFIIPFYEKKSYGHSGGIDGFSSMLSYFPEDKLAVSYCTNGQSYPVNDIVIGVLSIYYNKDYTIPSFKTLAVSKEELDQYAGTYASKDMPLKIMVTRNETTLMAQATGQGAFPLEATGPGQFKFDAAGITMEFRPEKDEFTLRQGGGVYIFTKE